MFGVILAGGSGTRFWPRSRRQVPKQLLPIGNSKTLLENTVSRLRGGIPIDRLHLVTHERHAFESCRLLAALGFPASHLWAEPVGRNTAPAIALAARVLQDKNPDEVMAVFPADHVIPDEDRFLRILRRAEQAAAAGFLVTLGIRPTRPETGYGYIRKGVPIDGLEETFRVRQFVEKPDASTARTYLEEGDYFWNGGMFLGKVSTFLEELKRHLPEVFQVLDDLVTHTQENKGKYPYRTLDSEGRKIYESLPDISVDYAVLEKTENLALVPAELRWSDVGSWRALGDIQKVDREGNLCTPNVVVLDCSDSILQGEERLIAGVGLRNLIVVDTPDALLVCDKDRAQDVKKLVQQLERENRPEIELGSTVRKPWGSYTVLEKRSHYLVKRIEVLPGEKLSLQSHNHRCEHWTVVQGEAEVERDGETFLLQASESTVIPQNAKHRLANPGKTLLLLIEVQMGERVDENDIIRYQDLYGRSG